MTAAQRRIKVPWDRTGSPTKWGEYMGPMCIYLGDLTKREFMFGVNLEEWLG